MSSIPSNIARMSNGMVYQMTQANLNRANLALLTVQTQLSTGQAIQRASDDPIRALGIFSIDQNMQRAQNHMRNFDFASTMLALLDAPLNSSQDLISQARDLASSQIGVISSASERQNMLSQVDSIIRTLYDNVNSRNQGHYLFGGTTSGTQPLIEVNGGYRYVGRGNGLYTDLGTSDRIPFTLGGNSTIGELSARQRSTIDLNPGVATDTPLADLRGARNLGVAPGTIAFSFNGGPVATIDLADAASMRDVSNRITAAIHDYETTNSVTILEGTGIVAAGQGFSIDVVAGGTLTFTDVASGTTGVDLGLTQAAFTDIAPSGAGLNPRLTLQTPVNALTGVTVPLGSIRIQQIGGGSTQSFDVDLSSAQTIDQIRNLIESGVPGVRLGISDDGNGIDIFNEIAGKSLSVSDIPGGANTALELGLRTFSSSTNIADFNFGRGVKIVDKFVNPVTGLIDPALNTDFRVTLGNGQYFDVDLTDTDMRDVGTVIAKINSAFAAAIGSQNNPSAPALAAGDFNARVSTGPNGFAFVSAVAGAIKIDDQNNSAAAEQLGLKNLTLNASTGEYVAEDRTTVRIDNVFTHLLALREALASNNSAGITLAGSDLSRDLDRLTGVQGLVATYGERIEKHKTYLEDQNLINETLRSNLADTDFTEAAAKLSQLSTQLQATLQSVGTAQGRTLFDYLR